MLAFLLQIAASSHLPKGNATEEEESADQNNAIYFDIMVIYSQLQNYDFIVLFHLLSVIFFFIRFREVKVVVVNDSST